jgi:DNA-binding MarR family transcriptional regulator
MKTTEIANHPLAVERLEKSLFDLSDVYRKHQEYIKTKHKVSALEMEIIQYIVLDGKKKMKEIGEHFNTKLSTLTSIIDKIEKQNLVKRVNSLEDRRVVFLDITKKGQKLYRDYNQHIRVLSNMMRETMNDDRFSAFVQGLEKMSQLVSGGARN